MAWTEKVRDEGGGPRVTFERSGMMGNQRYDGAIEIVCHRQYNGSGSKGFGGSSDWPCLTVTIPFKEDDESGRDCIAELLKQFIDKEIPDE